MATGVFVVLCIISFIFGLRPLIYIFVAALVGRFLCDIDINQVYTWYSGIWQGAFFVPNFIRHLIWDTPYKAELYTTGYNIWYWISSILSTLGFLFTGDGSTRD